MTEKTVLITGCSTGVGRATAVDFLRREWTVYATAREPADVADLDDAGCETAALDVTDGEAVDRVVDRVLDEQGRVDCLVNNAGYGQFGAMEDVPLRTLHAQFDVNVYGPHRLIRAVLPTMREQESGTIVNVSSVAGRVSTGGSGPYSASKHAIEAISDALRVELDPYDVDVVVVQPGPVRTQFGDNADEKLAWLDRSGAYDDIYDLQEDSHVLGSGDDFGVHPSEVAEVIADAACVADPDPRYPVGDLAKAGLFARRLPDRWRDSLYDLVRWVLT